MVGCREYKNRVGWIGLDPLVGRPKEGGRILSWENLLPVRVGLELEAQPFLVEIPSLRSNFSYHSPLQCLT